MGKRPSTTFSRAACPPSTPCANCSMPGVAASSTSMPPLSLVRQLDTVRLLPSRFANTEDSVLAPLAENEAELSDLFELDNATNQRLLAEQGGARGIGIDEL